MKKLFTYWLCGVLLLSSAMAMAQTSSSFTLTQAPCNNNGILTFNFSGLTAPYTVTWYINNISIVHNNVTGNSDALNSYSGAPCFVYVTDANNHALSNSYAGAPPFTYTVTANNAVCPAQGSASVTVSGGTAPYTYNWYTIPGNTSVSTSASASLPAGQYGITITDANGCVYGSAAQHDSIYIWQSSNITYNLTSTAANCTNGTATVSNISGGTTPYTYLWSNSATSSSIAGLTMGGYNVRVTDAQGCYTDKYTYIQQTTKIGVHSTATPATCLQNNGAVTAYGSGGTSPYSYQWSNSATTQNISGLAGNTYYRLKITDANGCIGNGGSYVSSSTPITVTTSTTASSCTSPTGSATLSISGGATPYTIQWYTSPAQSGTTATNLAPGNYSFKVTDANGCIRTGTVHIDPTHIINLQLYATNTTCTQSNGSINVTATGGSTPYTYQWTNSATTSSINNLAAGSYGVTVTDNAGCAVTKYRTIGTNSPVHVGLNTTPASCIFSSNGHITATAWGGTTPYTYSWSNGASTPAITGLSKGNYSVTVTDNAGCTAHSYTHVGYNPATNNCYCVITGTVYNDANSNCTKDAGEQGIANIQIHCSGIGYAYTDANGVYSFKVPSGTYTVSETVLGYYPLASCQNNSITVNASAGPNCTHTVNFANTVSTIHDMHISTWNYTCPVPGYVYKQKCIISNMGTVTESSVNAGYKTDGQIFSPTISPSGIFSGSGNYYKISSGSLSLAPSNHQTFINSYNVPTNIPLNTSLLFKDTVSYTAPMSNWQNDYSPWNNVNYYTPVTVGSYDPNFKEVMPKGKGPEGYINSEDTVLEYMVHFQNIGTYKAQNIYILDTLDANLDWTTMRPMYKSHPCDITMSENGIIRFQFDNIDLPYEAYDEEGSNGMVTYTIKLKKGLKSGTQIKNSAAIYFDFNEPVITNTTVNTIAPLSVSMIKGKDNSVTIYPNPAHNDFTVRINKGSYNSVKVMNTMGQVVAEKNITGQKTELNIGSAAPGIYFVLLNGTDGMKVEKIEKL